MPPFHPRLTLITVVTGILLIAILGMTVLGFRTDLRGHIRQRIIDRDASVLYAVAEAQLREAEDDPNNQAFVSEMLLSSVLKMVRGMRGVAIFDAEANTLRTLPVTLINTGLAPDDYAQLLSGRRIARYFPEFPMDRHFADERRTEPRVQPMLEVVIPIHARTSTQTVGFAKYYIDGAGLAAELELVFAEVDRQTIHTLAIGCGLIILVLAFSYAGLAHAQRVIAERNERLTRANFELTLAAKTSALGVITSHLIHGLQGPVAGLRAVVADQAAEGATSKAEWQSAANYTERMQTMIHETVALLGETTTKTSYELTGAELAATIRDRNHASAAAKGVVLQVSDGFSETIDSHRGSLICLVATNLTQNAIEATDPGRHVRVSLVHTPASIVLSVKDEGAGIPDAVRAHLFEPGRTGRAGGTGLGLAISHLMSRQIGATLELVSSGSEGTEFRLTVPQA